MLLPLSAFAEEGTNTFIALDQTQAAHHGNKLPPLRAQGLHFLPLGKKSAFIPLRGAVHVQAAAKKTDAEAPPPAAASKSPAPTMDQAKAQQLLSLFAERD